MPFSEQASCEIFFIAGMICVTCFFQSIWAITLDILPHRPNRSNAKLILLRSMYFVYPFEKTRWESEDLFNPSELEITGPYLFTDGFNTRTTE
jgi:hypothetical protein